MFERFTPRARRVLVVSEEEARRLGHSFIRPEHVFLGLLPGDGVAARVLSRHGVSLEVARAQFAEAIPSSAEATMAAKVPFSPEAKRTLELSLREALQLGHNYIGTEHLLLALVRQSEEEELDWLATVSGVGTALLRSSIEQLLKGFGAESGRSPAVHEATARARGLAGKGLLTTGHLLWAMLEDPRCTASQALEQLGVAKDAVEAALAGISVDDTSDAAPLPPQVEIRVGGSTVTVEDPAVASALSKLTPEELGDALRKALGTRRSKAAPRARRDPFGAQAD